MAKENVLPRNNCKVFKLIVLGDSGVGKTSLTYRFCKSEKWMTATTTVGVDFMNKTVTSCYGKDIKLHIWDTAGQERFRQSVVGNYYRNTHGIILVYDVTNLSSFENINVWLNECDKYASSIPDNRPRMLVGNKIDGTDVQVSTEDAENFAKSHGMLFFETSAHLDSEASKIEAIFVTMAKKIAKQQESELVSNGDLMVDTQSSSFSLKSLLEPPNNNFLSSCVNNFIYWKRKLSGEPIIW